MTSNRYDKIWEERLNTIVHELTIIEYVGNGKVKCLCSCGEYCVKRYTDMKKGRTKSCGHLKRAQQSPNCEGEKFNKLLAVKELEIVDGQRYYLFRCDCGNEVERKLKEVRGEKLKSCGCGEGNFTTHHKTHGLSKTRLYGIHKGMTRRCYNKKDNSYKSYGGRGISICREWQGEAGLINFTNWALNNGYKDSLSIDRINNDGNYEPSNCRWTDVVSQQNNTSQNIFSEYNGKTQTVAEWARELELTYDSLWKRLFKYNYSFEKAITHRIEKIKKIS